MRFMINLCVFRLISIHQMGTGGIHQTGGGGHTSDGAGRHTSDGAGGHICVFMRNICVLCETYVFYVKYMRFIRNIYIYIYMRFMINWERLLGAGGEQISRKCTLICFM